MIPQDLHNTGTQFAQKKVKAKHRFCVTPVIPVRMTSSIFPRPVTRITSHPKNIIKYRKRLEENLEKPRQLCAFKRLQEYLLQDSKGGIQAEAKVSSGANNLHTSPHFTSIPPLSSENIVQVQLSPSSFSQGVTLPVALPPLPSLSSQVVTTTDIRRQAQKVDIIRERLAALLESDRLARQAENVAEQRRRVFWKLNEKKKKLENTRVANSASSP
ncbi:putative methyl-CpG-binding domain protein 3-like 5 isoform X2 [Cricetulus griseus]|uniref:Methyl-CpG-binding domain protein 3-like 5 isoform X2 n=1 Tax=Cricetulus griseus TaxID=10029 RepID=A0A9J7K360_CRIGR|nr:putative methyl-CpG-binding domain protein 3-like 5 isoform X2 [Cricetulus griseus]